MAELESWASNPARVPINRLRWLWYYPKWPLILIAALILSICVSFTISAWFAIAAVLLALLNLFYWASVEVHLDVGDVNPGIVVQLRPTLIAVVTDLTKGEGSFPAVKILRLRLSKLMGERVQVGSRLPTVAMYSRSSRDCPYWSNFDPVPIECGTDDPGHIMRVMNSIRPEEWALLEKAIGLLPAIAPGLYQFEITD